MSTDVQKHEKKEAKARPKSSDKKTLGGHLKDLKAEFHKVVWPSRKDLIKQTATVIVTSGIIGAVIVGYDAAFAFGMQLFSAFILSL